MFIKIAPGKEKIFHHKHKIIHAKIEMQQTKRINKDRIFIAINESWTVKKMYVVLLSKIWKV